MQRQRRNGLALFEMNGIFLLLLVASWFKCTGANSSDIFPENIHKYIKEIQDSLNNTELIPDYNLLPYDLTGVDPWCKAAIFKYKDSITDSIWAMKMYDATTKGMSGIIMGDTIHLGNYDECMSISNITEEKYNLTFNAKFCMVKLIVNNRSLSLPTLVSILLGHVKPLQLELQKVDHYSMKVATCMPSSCSNKDIQLIYQNTFPSFANATVEVDHNCQVSGQRRSIDYKFWIVVAMFTYVIVFSIFSTYHQHWTPFRKYLPCCMRRTPNNYDERVPLELVEEMLKRPVLLLEEALNCFSITKSWATFIYVREDVHHPLYGISFISILCIIFGHRYLFNCEFPSMNRMFIPQALSSVKSLMFLPGDYAIETLFFLSGVYISLSKNRIFGRKWPVGLMFYFLHKIFRLIPLLVVLILIEYILLPSCGDGPLWNEKVNNLANSCKNSWWKILLFINNYIEPSLCIQQSWFVSAEFQLQLLGFLLLAFIKKNSVQIYCSLTVLLFGSFILIVLSFYVLELSVSLAGIEEWNKYHIYALLPSHMHLTAFIIGMLYGLYLHNNYHWLYGIWNHHRCSYIKEFLWILAAVFLFFPPYWQTKFYNPNYVHDELNEMAYFAFQKVLWPLGICIVIQLCVFRSKVPVYKLLSWKGWQIGCKLKYSMLLTHMTIQYGLLSTMRVPQYFSHYTSVIQGFGDLGLTLATSMALFIFIEAPFQQIGAIVQLAIKALFKLQNFGNEDILAPLHTANCPFIKAEPYIIINELRELRVPRYRQLTESQDTFLTDVPIITAPASTDTENIESFPVIAIADVHAPLESSVELPNGRILQDIKENTESEETSTHSTEGDEVKLLGEESAQIVNMKET